MKSLAIRYTPHLNRTIALLACVVAISMIAYGFFLLEAVAHTASLTNATRSVRTHMTHVSQLEEQYLSATKELTREKAQELGFVNPDSAQVSTVFADNVIPPTLSVRTN